MITFNKKEGKLTVNKSDYRCGFSQKQTPVGEFLFFIKLFEDTPGFNRISKKGIELIGNDLNNNQEIQSASDYLTMRELFNRNKKFFLKELAKNTFSGNIKVAYYGVDVKHPLYEKHCLCLNQDNRIRLRVIGIHGIKDESLIPDAESNGCVRLKGEELLLLNINPGIKVGKTILKVEM
tara:strand:- start:1553 stop:2089 length:537 start_codon:yes stop_codon:yes gene_type:complete